MFIRYNDKKFNIVINPKPDNCKECPFLRHYSDEECSNYEYCMLGHVDWFGCYINRPANCPLDIGIGKILEIN